MRLVSATPAGTNVIFSWQGVAVVSYFLQWRTNPSSSSPFMPLATNLIDQPGITTFTHTNPPPSARCFYRVMVPVP